MSEVVNVIQSVFPIHIVSGIAVLSRNCDLRQNLVSARRSSTSNNSDRIKAISINQSSTSKLLQYSTDILSTKIWIKHIYDMKIFLFWSLSAHYLIPLVVECQNRQRTECRQGFCPPLSASTQPFY